MVSNFEWRANVKEAIWEFSSKEHQYRIWFEQNKVWGHPDEDIAMFFDDLWIEDYVKSKNNYLTKKEKKGLVSFINLLNIFLDKRRNIFTGIYSLDPYLLYENDIEWENIRNEAKILYGTFCNEENIEREIINDFKLE